MKPKSPRKSLSPKIQEIFPKKCVFGISAGMLLGFIVRGIEVGLSKVRAILDMPPPSKRERGLIGRPD